MILFKNVTNIILLLKIIYIIVFWHNFKTFYLSIKYIMLFVKKNVYNAWYFFNVRISEV